MKFDLKSMTRKELEKLSTDVQKALKKAAERDRKFAMAAAQKAAKEHGFELSDITDATKPAKSPTKTTKRPKKPSTPKYANPADKEQTWTGKGRQPQWFKDLVASGKNAADLMI